MWFHFSAMADQVPPRTGAPRPAAVLVSEPPDWNRLTSLAGRCIGHVLPGSNDELIEDLSQEAMVRVMRALRATQARNIEALTSEIARRTAIDHLRSRRRWEALVGPWTEEAEETAGPPRHGPPGDPLERARFAILGLFERERSACLELAQQYFSDQSWSEVSERLGRTTDALRKQWSRCVAALRKAVRTDPDRLWRWSRDEFHGGGDAGV
jgi:RNA polymerase sigma factor (sigma-70 family)